MRLRRTLLVLFSLLLVAAPVRAAEVAPQVSDPCGDAGSYGEWNGDSMDFEENRPHLDIKNGRVAGTYAADGTVSGFKATIDVCGTASSTEGGYNISWAYGGQCYGQVSWTLQGRQTPAETGVGGHARSTVGPSAVVSEDCYREKTSPVDSGIDTIYSVTLPADAVSFQQGSVSFNVARSALPAAAQRRFADGTQWSSIGVVAMDQGPQPVGGLRRHQRQPRAPVRPQRLRLGRRDVHRGVRRAVGARTPHRPTPR